MENDSPLIESIEINSIIIEAQKKKIKESVIMIPFEIFQKK